LLAGSGFPQVPVATRGLSLDASKIQTARSTAGSALAGGGDAFNSEITLAAPLSSYQEQGEDWGGGAGGAPPSPDIVSVYQILHEVRDLG
jgi:hypothetical protein